MSNLDLFLRAYFYTNVQADRAILRLEPYFQCSPPVTVAPVNGRPVFVLIEIPPSQVPQQQFVPPTLISQITQTVLMYDGIIREKTAFNE